MKKLALPTFILLAGSLFLLQPLSAPPTHAQETPSTPVTVNNTPVSNINTANVHQWLYIKGMTQYDNLEDFRPDDTITRGEAAKFLTQYGRLLEKEQTYEQCEFSDLVGYDFTLLPFIDEVCAYGLIKGSNGQFFPRGTLTEAQALTIVIRAIEGFKDETKTPWYTDYFNRAQEMGLLADETMSSVQTTNVTRAKLGKWIYLSYVSQHPDEVIENPGSDDDETDDTTNQEDTTDNENNQDTESPNDTTASGDTTQEANIQGFFAYDPLKISKALSQGQQVVLIFTSPECAGCATLINDIQTNAAVILDDLAIFEADMSLAGQYNIEDPHTVLYLDGSGGVMYENVGEEMSLMDIITVIATENGNNDLSQPTI